MVATVAAIPFLPMGKKAAETRTDQINFRLLTVTIERMEAYRERHPLHPKLTQIVEAAVNKWLDEQEPELPAAPKPKGK